MGNRGGAMHDAMRTLGHRRWVSRQWIACQLSFNDRHREVMAPNRYTELFFLDEATALAAGHRPCFECRRADAVHFATIWGRSRGLVRRATAGEMDTELHAERLMPDGSKRICSLPVGILPAGTMISWNGETCAVVRPRLFVGWSLHGYGAITTHLEPALHVDVLTPPSIVAILRAGFQPQLHPTWPSALASDA